MCRYPALSSKRWKRIYIELQYKFTNLTKMHKLLQNIHDICRLWSFANDHTLEMN